TLAEEVKGYNIQVNAIAPGHILTDMVEEVLAAGEAAGHQELEAARRARESGGASVSAAVDLAVFLASEESGGLTGRLLSAVWDDWRSFPGQIDSIMKSEWYTLRRMTPKPP
ncbi:MAG: SDR family oxidoreductase, partial [Chloroflexi bacterium]|nr:SDR family oxidoreductase [Chloroflexota bacterium]